MHNSELTRGLASLMCLGMLSAGCIFTVSDDDGDTLSQDTDFATDDGADDSADDSADDASDDAADTGTDDGGTDPACTDELLLDPSFEGGTPNANWKEDSAMFGTPLCDDSCSEDEGAVPHDGDWFVWFGGVEGDTETASVTQTVTITGDRAIMSFYLAINAAAGTGEDSFAVSIDDQEIFAVTDEDVADYEGYTQVEIDVSDWADGEEHTLTFAAELPAAGLTNFFLDSMSVLSCDDGAGESGGSDDAADETGTGGSDSGSGDSGSSGSDGGSSSSG